MSSTFEPSTSQKSLADWMQHALHDLCQPLTALQCRLFLSTLNTPGSEQEQAEMRHAIEDGLRQCERMMVSVRGMQRYMDESQ